MRKIYLLLVWSLWCIQAHAQSCIVDAGRDTTICSGQSFALLKSTASASATSYTWATSGGGTFVPSNTVLHPTYIPSLADYGNYVNLTLTGHTSIGGTCVDNIFIQYGRPPVAEAGTALSVCASSSSVNINTANAQYYSSVNWTTSGTGTFSSSTSISPLYFPSAADKAAGQVVLRLTVLPMGGTGCSSAKDSTILIFLNPLFKIAPPPTCLGSGTTAVNLQLLKDSAITSFNWSSAGSGYFSSYSGTPTLYYPSTGDKAAGFVKIVVQGYSGPCTLRDTAIVYFNGPSAEAGANQTVCSNATSISLTGSVTNATGGRWTTPGTGVFSPSDSVLSPTYIPSASDRLLPSLKLKLTTRGNGSCSAFTDSMTVTFQAAPLVDAGLNQSVCSNTNSIALSGIRSGGTGQTWSTSGSGSFSNASVLNPNYVLSTSDKLASQIILRLTSTGNGVCAAARDSLIVSIQSAPLIDAGLNQSVCANLNPTLYGLLGTRTGGTGQTWTTSGTGSFSPNATVINPTYAITPADRAAGQIIFRITSTGNGICTASKDSMILTFQPAPVINAGLDQSICSNTTSIALNGSKTGSTGQSWSSSGSGIFTPNNTVLNPVYILSVADRVSSVIVLQLTSTGNGVCTAAKDSLIITIQPSPVVDAGANQTVCSNINSITLSGSRIGGTGQSWSTSGSGSFSPNGTVLAPTYTFSAADKASGQVIIRITSTGNGLCSPATDSMVVTFQTASVVDAGPNQTVCSNVATVNLNGSRTGGTGQLWTTTGTGTFAPNITVLNPVYTFTSIDKATGSVSFYLTSTGSCAPASDSIVVTFRAAPIIDAGSDQQVCPNPNITIIGLSGSRANATGQLWTTTGTGTFAPSATSLNPGYTFSAADKAAGQVTLIITSIGNGICPAAVDSMTATFLPIPSANAGPDQTVCGNGTFIELNGSVSNVPAGEWTTTGSGSFLPNPFSLNVFYYPSPLDIASGSVLVMLTPFGNNCSNSPDSAWITFVAPPQVYAGPDQIVCQTTDSIYLNGSGTNFPGVQWYTFGGGIFVPSQFLASTKYNPSAGDIAAGFVTLEMRGSGYAGCPSDTSSLTIHFVPCQDTCTAQVSFQQSLVGKTVYVDAIVSSPTPGSYQWSFGDGNYGSGSSANHTYANPGTYTICLNFRTIDSVCTIQYCQTVKINKCYVSVNFTKDIHQDTVFFSAATTPSTPGEYFWDFGDGVIGKGQTVSHVYGQSGLYPVSLSFYSSDNTCVCEAVYTDSVNIRICPKIYFVQSVNSTTATFNAFANASVIGTYYWDFGDGTFATGANVTHTFPSTGTYPVTLELYSHNGSCQCLCHAVYTNNVTLSNCNLQVYFTDTIAQNNVTFHAYPMVTGTYEWNFGDGNQSVTTSPVVSYTYPAGGLYTVTLFVTDVTNPFDTCRASFADSVFVNSVFMAESQVISVHPVPASETLNYKITSLPAGTAESVEIVNSMGGVVKKSENVDIEPSGNTFELGALPSGLYVIKVTSHGKVHSKPFLKD